MFLREILDHDVAAAGEVEQLDRGFYRLTVLDDQAFSER